MMSTNNILHPANGQPIIVPSQDIVLGLYYLSLASDNEPGEGMAFASMGEIEHALSRGIITLHTKIKGRFTTVDAEGNRYNEIHDTTPGRMMIAQLLPKSDKVPFEACNQLMTKKMISKLIDTVYRGCGQKETVIFCDQVMDLGFRHACKAGISFGKDDMVIPDTKQAIVEKNGRHAVTHYKTLMAFGGNAWTVSKIACQLETGRTHQIRVHLAHIGHALLGDPTYGIGFESRERNLPMLVQKSLKSLSRQALHAVDLTIAHPVSGAKMHFSSPFPTDMENLEKTLQTADS